MIIQGVESARKECSGKFLRIRCWKIISRLCLVVRLDCSTLLNDSLTSALILFVGFFIFIRQKEVNLSFSQMHWKVLRYMDRINK